MLSWSLHTSVRDRQWTNKPRDSRHGKSTWAQKKNAFCILITAHCRGSASHPALPCPTQHPAPSPQPVDFASYSRENGSLGVSSPLPVPRPIGLGSGHNPVSTLVPVPKLILPSVPTKVSPLLFFGSHFSSPSYLCISSSSSLLALHSLSTH